MAYTEYTAEFTGTKEEFFEKVCNWLEITKHGQKYTIKYFQEPESLTIVHFKRRFGSYRIFRIEITVDVIAVNKLKLILKCYLIMNDFPTLRCTIISCPLNKGIIRLIPRRNMKHDVYSLLEYLNIEELRIFDKSDNNLSILVRICAPVIIFLFIWQVLNIIGIIGSILILNLIIGLSEENIVLTALISSFLINCFMLLFVLKMTYFAKVNEKYIDDFYAEITKNIKENVNLVE